MRTAISFVVVFATAVAVMPLLVQPTGQAGFREGDVIVGIDGMTVRSSDDLVRALDRTGMQVRVRLVRNGVPDWIRGAR